MTVLSGAFRRRQRCRGTAIRHAQQQSLDIKRRFLEDFGLVQFIEYDMVQQNVLSPNPSTIYISNCLEMPEDMNQQPHVVPNHFGDDDLEFSMPTDSHFNIDAMPFTLDAEDITFPHHDLPSDVPSDSQADKKFSASFAAEHNEEATVQRLLNTQYTDRELYVENCENDSEVSLTESELQWLHSRDEKSMAVDDQASALTTVEGTNCLTIDMGNKSSSAEIMEQIPPEIHDELELKQFLPSEHWCLWPSLSHSLFFHFRFLDVIPVLQAGDRVIVWDDGNMHGMPSRMKSVGKRGVVTRIHRPAEVDVLLDHNIAHMDCSFNARSVFSESQLRITNMGAGISMLTGRDKLMYERHRQELHELINSTLKLFRAVACFSSN